MCQERLCLIPLLSQYLHFQGCPQQEGRAHCSTTYERVPHRCLPMLKLLPPHRYSMRLCCWQLYGPAQGNPHGPGGSLKGKNQKGQAHCRLPTPISSLQRLLTGSWELCQVVNHQSLQASMTLPTAEPSSKGPTQLNLLQMRQPAFQQWLYLLWF